MCQTSILVADITSPGRSNLLKGFPQQHGCSSPPADLLLQSSCVQCPLHESSELKIAVNKTRHSLYSCGVKSIFYLGCDVEAHGQRAGLNLNLFKMQVICPKLKMGKYKAGSQALQDVISIFFPVDNLFHLSVELRK